MNCTLPSKTVAASAIANTAGAPSISKIFYDYYRTGGGTMHDFYLNRDKCFNTYLQGGRQAATDKETQRIWGTDLVNATNSLMLKDHPVLYASSSTRNLIRLYSASILHLIWGWHANTAPRP